MVSGVNYLNIFNEDGSTKLITGADLVMAELSLLFKMDKYSLFFGNNMGLDLEKYLYTNNKVATFNLIKSDIEAFFATYPKAILKRLEIQFDKLGKAIINLTLNVNGSLVNVSLGLPKDGTLDTQEDTLWAH